jgi:hypothetical protein
VARHKRDRISTTDYNRITATVPNRLTWYDGMNFNLSPVVPVVSVLPRLAAWNGNLRKHAIRPHNLLILTNQDNRTFDAKGRQRPRSAKSFAGT